MKIICVGRNFADHIAELKNETPTAPVIFLKPDSALLPPRNPFFLPDFSTNVQHEIELVVRINRLGKHIQEKFAHKYYEEITVGLDFTARDLQDQLKAKGLPWEKAKGFDGSAVVGEWVHKSSLGAMPWAFHLEKNGTTVQTGSTDQMIHSIDRLIAYVSQYFTLRKGDFIFTGTPAGVGKVEKEDLLVGYLGQQKLFQINVK